MGAITAFSRAFSLVGSNKNAYFALLLILLIVLPIGTYLSPSVGTPRKTATNGVIFEEYGALGTEEELLWNAKTILVYTLLSILILSAVQYGITKVYMLALDGEKCPLGELLLEGIPLIPGVIAVNVLAYILLMLISLLPAGLILAGSLTVPHGIFLILIGIFVLFFLLPFGVSFFSMVVPAYVEEKSVSAVMEALNLAISNPWSSLGFGILVLLLVLAGAVVMSPFMLLVELLSPSPVFVSFVEAPFDAFIIAFLWAGGASLYRELKEDKEY
jgi:hypothetical protein